VNTDLVFLKKIPLALGLENEMIQDQMAWEAEQFFLSPIDRFVIDTQRLPFQTQSGNPYYVFVAIRKKVIAAFQTVLEKVGLVLKDVDLDIFSTVRSVLANYPVGIDDLLLLLDVQRNAVIFSFVRQKEFFLSHRAALKTGDSSDDQNGDEILGQWFVKELRRLIFGHRLCRDIEDVQKIFLTGSDGVQRMKTVLETRVSIPVEIVNPFAQIQKSPLVLQSQDYSQCPEKYAAAVGVALKQLPDLAGFQGRIGR
jgi:type IV pilus assembly protein PilM